MKGLQGVADAAALGANDETASSTPPAQKSSRDEVFPTGLVLCKYFREASTGREILMLEVEKVGALLIWGSALVGYIDCVMCSTWARLLRL